MLTAGVDVQKDRLELEIVGWGKNMESWSIDYIRLYGDPAQEDVWKQLDRVIDSVYESDTPEAYKFLISKVAIDSGDNTQHVYNYVRSKRDPRVIAVKGKSTGVLPVEAPKAVDVQTSSSKKRRGIQLHNVVVGIVKEELYSFLQLEPPLEPGEPYPRGYCHFPDYDEEYFKQLTAEEKKKVIRKGVATYAWEKLRDRNEALDCRVYARAAAYVHKLDIYRDEHWLELEHALANQLIKDQPKRKTRKTSDFW